MFWENLREALRAIRANWLRAVLTMCIIAFGILAIVGVLTSIDGIKYWMSASFSTLGTNTFVIKNVESSVRIGRRREKIEFDKITYRQAVAFADTFSNDATVSLSAQGNFQATVRYRGRESNPNIQVAGTDQNFLLVESYELAAGRSITPEDVQHGANVAVIGHQVQEQLFAGVDPVGRTLVVDNHQYRVVGVLAEKGTSFGSPGDKVVKLPITTLERHYSDPDRSIDINVYIDQPERMTAAVQAAYGTFRRIRRLLPTDPTNFSVVMSQSFIDNLLENLAILTLSATAIAFITLAGASIGLMNILLVSVTERTREIGTRKALGARRSDILLQFLTEAILICLLGGAAGILLGVLAGNGIGAYLGSPFLIPWGWIVLGFSVSLVVGLISGIYPARKASRLDPIAALRYE